jgi:hypothetical protein
VAQLPPSRGPLNGGESGAFPPRNLFAQHVFDVLPQIGVLRLSLSDKVGLI